jgi:hypothetical protein
MRVSRLAFFGLGVVTVAVAAVPIAKHVANLPGKIDVDGSMRLPNGERIHAVGRSKISLHGDMPLAFFPSASGAYCYVVTGGHHDHGISLINLRGDVDEFYIPQTKCTGGIIESSDGTGLFAAGDLMRARTDGLQLNLKCPIMRGFRALSRCLENSCSQPISTMICFSVLIGKPTIRFGP